MIQKSTLQLMAEVQIQINELKNDVSELEYLKQQLANGISIYHMEKHMRQFRVDVQGNCSCFLLGRIEYLKRWMSKDLDEVEDYVPFSRRMNAKNKCELGDLEPGLDKVTERDIKKMERLH